VFARYIASAFPLLIIQPAFSMSRKILELFLHQTRFRSKTIDAIRKTKFCFKPADAIRLNEFHSKTIDAIHENDFRFKTVDGNHQTSFHFKTFSTIHQNDFCFKTFCVISATGTAIYLRSVAPTFDMPCFGPPDRRRDHSQNEFLFQNVLGHSPNKFLFQNS